MKVIDLSGEMLELRGDAVELDPGQVATAVGWTPDGQLLTVATTVSCRIAGRMHHPAVPQGAACSKAAQVFWLTLLQRQNLPSSCLKVP